MAPYSMDLRQRVARAWDGGLDADTIAAKYEVSRAWVHRLIQRRRETGSLERFRLRRSTIAAVACVGRAFVGREELQRDSDETADLLQGARTSGAQEGFQFGERE